MEDSVAKYQMIDRIKVEYPYYDPESDVIEEKIMRNILEMIARLLKIKLQRIKRVVVRVETDEELNGIFEYLKKDAIVPGVEAQDIKERAEIMVAEVYTQRRNYKVACIHIFALPDWFFLKLQT